MVSGLVVLFLGFGITTFAAEPTHSQAEISISELSHENYRIRNSAEEMLRRGGEANYDLLKKTASESPDLEARLRAKTLVAELERERIWNSANDQRPRPLVAKTGALTLKLNPTEFRRWLIEGKHLNGEAYQFHHLRLPATLQAESHLGILQYRNSPVEATATEPETGIATNRSLRVSPTPQAFPTQELPLTIHFEAYKLPTRKIDLNVTVEVLAAGPFATFKIPEPQVGKDYGQEKVYFRILERKSTENGKLELTLDLGTDLLPQFLEASIRQSLVLRDQNGDAIPYTSFTLPQTPEDSEEVEEVAKEIDWELPEEERPIVPADPYYHIRTAPLTGGRTVNQIEMTYPRYVSKRNVEFSFKDVEIPTAKP